MNTRHDDLLSLFYSLETYALRDLIYSNTSNPDLKYGIFS
jgi:hypothetical protein